MTEKERRTLHFDKDHLLPKHDEDGHPPGLNSNADLNSFRVACAWQQKKAPRRTFPGISPTQYSYIVETVVVLGLCPRMRSRGASADMTILKTYCYHRMSRSLELDTVWDTLC